MEIKYNNRQIRIGFIVGAIFLIVGITSLMYSEKPSYFFLGGGIAYLIIGFYRLKTSYVTVEDGYIKVDFGGKVVLKEIVEIKYFAGDYNFKTKSSQVTIDTNAVDKKSLLELQEFAKNFKVVEL